MTEASHGVFLSYASEDTEWLNTAMRLRDPGLALLKTDPLMDPLRQEPRFRR